MTRSEHPPGGKRTDAPRWLDHAVYAGSSLPPWVALAVLVAMLAIAWLAVYASGGSQRALPHLFYIPIVLASLPFGLRGTLGTAVVSAVLVGPLMPLDTATGEAQQPSSWVIRAVMFVVIGGTVALCLAARERIFEDQLADEVRRTLGRSPQGAPVDVTLVPLVAGVLATQAFHPVYQPIYSLADGRLVGVEALSRFDIEPYRPPDVWFAAAFEAGVGVDLEIAAITMSIRHAEGLPLDVGLSLNASPGTLADPRLTALLTENEGRQLTLEITEHAVVEDYEGLADTVTALRALGVRIAVDDAGAGVSSLRHIVQLAPDTIKLDMSLTQDVAASPLRRALAGSLIEFAQRTGAQLLVEGIEARDDLHVWTHLGAHTVQGYLTGRPSALPVPTRSAAITPRAVMRVAAARSAG